MSKERCLQEISAKILKLLGLYFTENRLKDLERGVLASIKELHLGFDIYKFNDWLTNITTRSSELKVISKHLTVGETYFFREPPALELFQKKIIPELIKERQGKNQYIKIWSAGCCSGEEPYTLAMILCDLIPNIEDWNITILASDINTNSLSKAQAGIYSEWSFRETLLQYKEKYFKEVKNGWEISDKIKKMVNFFYLNLSEDTFPSQHNSINSVDVIFCRNVLMYFSAEVVKQVVDRFYKTVVKQGWLISSQVELNDDYFSVFARIQYEKGIFYRKVAKSSEVRVLSSFSDSYVESFPISKTVQNITPANKAGSTIRRSAVSKSITKPEKELYLQHFEKGEYQRCIDALVSTSNKNFDDDAIIIIAKSYANMGKLGDARSWIEKIIDNNSISGEIYYLYSTILMEQSEWAMAEAALKKVLFLSPDHLFGHFAMGNVLSNVGKTQQAKRHYKNMISLLDNWNDNDIVPGSEGMTSKRIREMIDMLV